MSSNLFNEIAFADLDLLRVSEGGDDLGAGDERQALDPVEVRVLNGHNALVGKQLNKKKC